MLILSLFKFSIPDHLFKTAWRVMTLVTSDLTSGPQEEPEPPAEEPAPSGSGQGSRQGSGRGSQRGSGAGSQQGSNAGSQRASQRGSGAGSQRGSGAGSQRGSRGGSEAGSPGQRDSQLMVLLEQQAAEIRQVSRLGSRLFDVRRAAIQACDSWDVFDSLYR